MTDQLLIPLKKQLGGQAKLILKGIGLGLLKPKFFNVDAKKMAAESAAYERADAGVVGGNGGYDIKASFLDLPVWDVVTLVAKPYTTDEGTVITTESRLQLPIALCEVSNARNIVKTTIAGRDGTIKEYMSNGDYSVIIQGIISSEYSNIPPTTDMYNLRTIIEHPEALEVHSNFLDFFDITHLVIDEPIVKQIEGTRNAVSFELRCSSDLPFELDA